MRSILARLLTKGLYGTVNCIGVHVHYGWGMPMLVDILHKHSRLRLRLDTHLRGAWTDVLCKWAENIYHNFSGSVSSELHNVHRTNGQKTQNSKKGYAPEFHRKFFQKVAENKTVMKGFTPNETTLNTLITGEVEVEIDGQCIRSNSPITPYPLWMAVSNAYCCIAPNSWPFSIGELEQKIEILEINLIAKIVRVKIKSDSDHASA